MHPGSGPERLPNDFNSAQPGRFATAKKNAKAKIPSDDEAKPERLLKSGVYIPDEK